MARKHVGAMVGSGSGWPIFANSRGCVLGGVCLVMSPQVRVLRAALWRSLSSEAVPLRCGMQPWGLWCEV